MQLLCLHTAAAKRCVGPELSIFVLPVQFFRRNLSMVLCLELSQTSDYHLFFL